MNKQKQRITIAEDQAARFHDEIVSRQGTVRANQELDLKELNQLRDQLAEARQRETVAIASWDEERGRVLREGARVVEWRDRAERAEAEVERLGSDRDCEKRLRKDADEFRENAIERATKAEADLAALEQCHDDNCRAVVAIAGDLAIEREKSERYRLVTLRQDAELATERGKVRVLKLDKDRLDWWNGESYYQFGKSHKCMNPGWWWSCGFDQIQDKSGIKNIRDAIDSAMAHSKSGRNKYNVCKRIEKSETEGTK